MSDSKPAAQRGWASLFEDLRNGNAGPGLRVLVSLAVGALLCGLASGAACYMAVVWHTWTGRSRWQRGYLLGLDAGVLLLCFLVAAVFYAVALHWLWSRPLRRRGFWLAGATTIGIWLVVILLCLSVGQLLVVGGELGAFAVVCIGIAATLLTWIQGWRRYGEGRPAFDDAGHFDVRCPSCGYSMIGLYDTSCPECGEKFTLDQLLQRQGFEEPARR